MNNYLTSYRTSRKLTTVVENQSTYYSEFAELNIFETLKTTEKVYLQFDVPIIASMLTGKKIMHLKDRPAFDFLPGESLVVPANQPLFIDFPEAAPNRPTECLALNISTEKIKDVVLKFNQQTAIESENSNWQIDDLTTHLPHNEGINQLIKRLVYTFTSNNSSKSTLLDLMIQELIIRLLQTKAKYSLFHDRLNMFSDHRIGMVIRYIQDHLTEKDITIDLLAKKACMSTSSFHKKFKNTLGTSPIEYINGEKIKFAKNLLKENRKLQISEVAALAGFNNKGYFTRTFKKIEMITPQQFKMHLDQTKAF